MTFRVPPVIHLAIFAFLGWGLSILLPQLDFAWKMKGILGWFLVSSGVILLLFAVGMFARAETTINPIRPNDAEALVTNGLYRFSRNPMYLALAIILFGGAFLVGNIASFATTALFVVVMTQFQIQPEERALEENFGDKYRNYCQRTRRWI